MKLKSNLKLHHKKASQEIDVSVKIFKEYRNILSKFFNDIINGLIKSSKFPLSLKLVETTLIQKKVNTNCKISRDHFIFYKIYLKPLKSSYSVK